MEDLDISEMMILNFIFREISCNDMCWIKLDRVQLN